MENHIRIGAKMCIPTQLTSRNAHKEVWMITESLRRSGYKGEFLTISECKEDPKYPGEWLVKFVEYDYQSRFMPADLVTFEVLSASPPLCSFPQVGGIYEHHKGGQYRYLLAAREEATQRDVAVYQSLETNQVWTRPFEEFCAPRFVLLPATPVSSAPAVLADTP
jgi:hypothetical protein